MAQLDELLPAGEEDLVVAGDGAAPDGGDTDLPAVPGLSDGMAVPYVLRLVGEGGGEGVGQQQSGAAGGVHLFVVVALYDLDVKVLPQQQGRLTGQLGEHIDAQGEVGGAEDGDGPGRRFDLQELVLGVAGGGQHHGQLPLDAVAQQGGEGGGVGEVHRRLGGDGALGGGGEDGEIPAAVAQNVEAGGDVEVGLVGAQGLQHPAHPAVAAGEDEFQHGGASFYRSVKRQTAARKHSRLRYGITARRRRPGAGRYAPWRPGGSPGWQGRCRTAGGAARPRPCP